MKVYLLNTKKRNNSTTVSPLGDTVEEVFLKENTSIIRPVFLLEYDISILEYNYLYCEEFSRYYFIRNISTGLNNYWELECEVDTLASHKADILQNTCFIERASVGYNEKIVDNLVTNTTDFETTNSSIYADFFNDEGSYFLKCVSDAKMSAIWNLDSTQLNTLAKELLTDDGFINELQKYYTQPLNAIYSLHWLPISKGGFGGVALDLSIGEWVSDLVNTYRVDTPILQREILLPIPKPYSDFRISDCKYMLHIPCCTPIPLDVSYIEPSDNLYIKLVIDCTDGNMCVKIYTLENGLIAKTSGNIKSEMPVASITANPLAIASGVISGLATTVGGFLSKDTTMALSGLYTTVQSVNIPPQVSAVGNYVGRGAYISDEKKIILSCTYCSTVEPNEIANICGRPVMKEDRLFNYSGFVKCDSASVKINATLEEIETVNNLLNGGVYIE